MTAASTGASRRRHQRRRRGPVAHHDQRLRRDLGPADGLRRDSTLMWWGDDADLERGLDFGSPGASTTSTSTSVAVSVGCSPRSPRADERCRAHSLLGLGVDYATGIQAPGRSPAERCLRGQLGGGARPRDAARHAPLGRHGTSCCRPATCSPTCSLRGAVSYDLRSRSVEVAGRAVPDPKVRPWPAPRRQGSRRPSTSAATCSR